MSTTLTNSLSPEVLLTIRPRVTCNLKTTFTVGIEIGLLSYLYSLARVHDMAQGESGSFH